MNWRVIFFFSCSVLSQVLFITIIIKFLTRVADKNIFVKREGGGRVGSCCYGCGGVIGVSQLSS